jgi:phosphatidyl-myo-inositol alpha-mannosyltransferase
VKVALVCPYDWASPGGVRGHVEALAAYLRREHEVLVLAPSSSPPPRGVERVGRPVGVRYNASVAPIAPAPTAGRRTVRRLQAFEPHVVHVHEPLVPAVSVAASATCLARLRCASEGTPERGHRRLWTGPRPSR